MNHSALYNPATDAPIFAPDAFRLGDDEAALIDKARRFGARVLASRAAQHDRNAPPPVVEKMAGKIPGAYYICLSGLGHMPNLEAPAAFDGAIFNFLAHVLAR